MVGAHEAIVVLGEVAVDELQVGQVVVGEREDAVGGRIWRG